MANFKGDKVRPICADLELYEHQKEIVLDPPYKMLIAWECGTGKTAAAIAICQKYKLRALIIGIKNNVQNWVDEIIMWKADFEYLILTKEQFKKQYKELPKYDCVVIDEAHYFSGRTSQCHKRMKWYLNDKRVIYRYLLTGTPYMSTPWNVFALADLLDKCWNWHKFEEEFFTIWDRKNNKWYSTREQALRAGAYYRHLIPMAKKHIENKIAALINSIGVTKKLEDCVDMPKAVFKREYCFVEPHQRKLINELPETIPIAKITKIHQILGGTLKGENVTFDCDKRRRVIELIREHKKLMVVCHYTLEIEMLESLVKDKKIYIINGDTKDPHAVGKVANLDPECVLLINASCSEAQNLPNFNQVVFYSLSFSLKDYVQMIGRTRRANSPQRCVYTALVVKDSIDEKVYDCVVNRKMDVQTAIFNNKF